MLQKLFLKQRLVSRPVEGKVYNKIRLLSESENEHSFKIDWRTSSSAEDPQGPSYIEVFASGKC